MALAIAIMGLLSALVGLVKIALERKKRSHHRKDK